MPTSNDTSLSPRVIIFDTLLFVIMFDHLPLKMMTSFMNDLYSRDMAALTIIGYVMYFISEQNSGQQNSAQKSRQWL